MRAAVLAQIYLAWPPPEDSAPLRGVPSPLNAYSVIAARKLLPAKTRLFIEHLTAHFAGPGRRRSETAARIFLWIGAQSAMDRVGRSVTNESLSGHRGTCHG
jgi:hypothetical protein